MQVVLEVIIVLAALLAGMVFTPMAVKRTPGGHAPRRAPSGREFASGTGGLVVLHRRRYRH